MHQITHGSVFIIYRYHISQDNIVELRIAYKKNQNELVRIKLRKPFVPPYFPTVLRIMRMMNSVLSYCYLIAST